MQDFKKEIENIRKELQNETKGLHAKVQAQDKLI